MGKDIKIMNKCIKCGKEFPAVTYKFVKSVYGVGVPEYMKDYQNGALETYDKTMCDDCMREKLDDKVQEWNPAQEILISYIKECDLNIFEVEKVHEFISKEIKTKRYRGKNS